MSPIDVRPAGTTKGGAACAGPHNKHRHLVIAPEARDHKFVPVRKSARPRMGDATQGYLDMFEKIIRSVPGANQEQIASLKAYVAQRAAAETTPAIAAACDPVLGEFESLREQHMSKPPQPSGKTRHPALRIHIIREPRPDADYPCTVAAYGLGYGRLNIPVENEADAKALAEGLTARKHTSIAVGQG